MTLFENHHWTVIEREAWANSRERYRQAILPFTTSFRERRARGQLHPIYDFLFSYYTYSSKKLEVWHPGFGVRLASAGESLMSDYLHSAKYEKGSDGVQLAGSAMRERDIKQLLWVRALCNTILSRPGRFSCFGLHEWAMVYRTEDIRHSTPLRLTHDQVADVVEKSSLCCSHFDAFRFFSPRASKLNILQPSSDGRIDNEQSGCIHANMDLYKWAYKLSPIISSDILGECFKLALEAREIDMRASPYDLRELGFEPIPIETEEGRSQYQILQRAISTKAQTLRHHLVDAIEQILSQISESAKERILRQMSDSSDSSTVSP